VGVVRAIKAAPPSTARWPIPAIKWA
jgi:hypothetical protein